MLFIGLISLLISYFIINRITPSLFNRITVIILIYSSLLAYNSLNVESLGSGIGIYGGLFQVNIITIVIEFFIFLIGALAIIGWASIDIKKSMDLEVKMEGSSFIPKKSEYSLIILFTTIGGALLISSSDLVSIYLSIELQSFGVYILATLYRNSESSTAAGLKYFLLGGLSSSLILLGTALIYKNTGLTQYESIYNLISVSNNIDIIINQYTLVFGISLIGVGFLFKVAAAPFHNWAPDVYNGVPTIVTTWLTTIPKISIFVFLLELQIKAFGRISLEYNNGLVDVIIISDSNIWKNLLLVTSLFSLIIGTVVGLSQNKIKRLLAYSTISHVGFLLLALSINTEQSIESFVFYLVQYSITNINIFIIILAFGYIIKQKQSSSYSSKDIPRITEFKDIEFINDIKGVFKNYSVLSLSFSICLFSIAGIPPLIGFFAKQIVLYSSIHAGYYFISLIAILVSVISASYYLKIIKVIYFTNSIQTKIFKSNKNNLTNIHSIIIAILTIIIILFVLQPSILLNSCHLLSLSLFYN